MKIVIQHGKIKREIDGPFSLFIHEDDLRRMKGIISRKLKEGFDYGWIEFIDLPESIPNTAPISWDDPASASKEGEAGMIE